MDYQKHYNNLVEKARNRKLEGYYEKHHIIPKCLGGLDTKENIVKVTAKEHFIMHLLLHKIYPKHYGLCFAVFKMSKYGIYNAQGYENLKKEFSKIQSKNRTGKPLLNNRGEKHHYYGKTRSDKTKLKISKSLKGNIPGNKGIPVSEERKIRISKSLGGKPFKVFKNNEFVGIWKTQHGCATDLSLYVSHINRCLKGRLKTTKGYRFEYV